MRKILTIVVTILLLFAESFLLDIPLMRENPLRVTVIIILFAVTAWLGFRVLQVQSSQPKN